MRCSHQLRLLAALSITVSLGGLLLFVACSSSGGGGGTGPPDGGDGAGTGGGGFPITGESFTLDLGGGAVFDMTAGGEAVRSAFAVQLFTETPTDSPATGTLSLDTQDVQIAGAAGSITVTAYVGAGSSTNPCDDGQDAGSFTLVYDGATVSLSTGELSLSGVALSYVSSGSFTLCLTASGNADATMEIVSMTVRFASAAEPGPGTGDDDAGSTLLLEGAKVEFPAEGDAMMLLSEDSGVGSAAFFGYEDDQEVIPRLLISEIDGEPFEVVMDLEGRVARTTVGNLAADFSHNADGSFDLTISDDEGVRFVETAILPSTAKIVTTGLRIGIDLDLDLCATSLILGEVERQLPNATEAEQACYLNQDTLLFVFAREACLTWQGLKARLDEVRNACPGQDDAASCVDRVEPWLTATADTQEKLEASVARFVDVLDRWTGGPCATNTVDNAMFGAPRAETLYASDDDKDGVVRARDLCKDTPSGEPVNAFGCSVSQIGAIECEDVIPLGDNCVRDGCCEDYCFAPFDPDCTNKEICEPDHTFCCEDGRECEVNCPQYDSDCDDPELACAVDVIVNCSEDDCCQPGCRDPFDPDCTNARLCEFWETTCCADGVTCTEGCPEPDPDCDGEPEPQAGVVTSTFDTSDEGWFIGPSADFLGAISDSGEATYEPSGGNPGGYISHENIVSGLDSDWFFIAPAKFDGDWSSTYGKKLTFDLRVFVDEPEMLGELVVLSNGEKHLRVYGVLSDLPAPGATWTSYSISLDTSAGWRVTTDWFTSDDATEADIRDVLSSLSDLRIRGQFYLGPGSGELDNVVFGAD